MPAPKPAAAQGFAANGTQRGSLIPGRPDGPSRARKRPKFVAVVFSGSPAEPIFSRQTLPRSAPTPRAIVAERTRAAAGELDAEPVRPARRTANRPRPVGCRSGWDKPPRLHDRWRAG